MANPSMSARAPRMATSRLSASRRLAVIGPTGVSLRRLRGGLLAEVIAQRHQVMCFAHGFDGADGAMMAALGIAHHELPPVQPGLVLFAERRAVKALTRDLDSWRPHVLLAYGRDTMLTAVKAARAAKVERIVALITDIGVEPKNGSVLRRIGRTLELVDAAVFHNADHPKILQAKGLLPADLTFAVVPGAGVDIADHPVQPLPPLGEGLAFLMVATLDRAKGVLDYCNAARIVKARAPSARFVLAGPPGVGTSAVTRKSLAGFADCVEYLGPLDDVRPALGQCHVYVYPSHGEGMPLSVLEALASGRPVITTDGPGCRETVDVRVNGVLVPKANPEALATAMESFLKRPDLIPAMARASRTKAERRFDRVGVNATLFQVLGLG